MVVVVVVNQTLHFALKNHACNFFWKNPWLPLGAQNKVKDQERESLVVKERRDQPWASGYALRCSVPCGTQEMLQPGAGTPMRLAPGWTLAPWPLEPQPPHPDPSAQGGSVHSEKWGVTSLFYTQGLAPGGLLSLPAPPPCPGLCPLSREQLLGGGFLSQQMSSGELKAVSWRPDSDFTLSYVCLDHYAVIHIYFRHQYCLEIFSSSQCYLYASILLLASALRVCSALPEPPTALTSFS